MVSMRRTTSGFTLTELAVVLTIVALLLSSVMYTLSAQTEQRNRTDALRRLENARELLLSFAIVNGRLPCPAWSTGPTDPGTYGDESFSSGSAASGGGTCSNYLNGYLPARAIGFGPTDSVGFALDPWGNRIRYALAETASNPTGGSGCTGPASPAYSSKANLKSNGIVCAPNTIVICDAAENINPVPPVSCGTPSSSSHARPVTNVRTVVAVVHSIGKNGAVTTPGSDEAQNINGNGVFVWHEPRPNGAAGGEFDDLLVWIPIGNLYSRMISAGALP